jgi:primosomal protein N' (replication factor Y)
VGLVHSRLSPGERYDTWRRARTGQLPVIVGARSALFTPLPDPGLIVVDECHDESYFQDDFTPSYDAVEAALAYGRINHAAVVLGSATPGVSRLYQARQQRWSILNLPLRIAAHREHAPTLVEQPPDSLPLPDVEVVDMRQELKAGNRSMFSRSLQDSLEKVLASNQQAILFLNRRGAYTYIFCRDCGEVLCCPRCSLPLTYHNSGEALFCHTCGYKRQMPQTCPNCGSHQMRQFGAGTERVEAELHQMFPEARILRWDAESTRQKGSHEIILSHFRQHNADILIGTQMLAKGLDLPLVTLVGVVLADVGLFLPDYRAGERGFQTLSQVIGRAGRSPLGGKAILQTYHPEHEAIQAAARHDIEGFYAKELEYRGLLHYPPFYNLARLEFRSLKEEEATDQAQRAASQILDAIEEQKLKETEIIGPVPCFFARQNGFYRWQIVLRSPDPARFLRENPVKDAHISINPPSLL